MSESAGGWRPQRSRKSTLICYQRRRAKALNLLMKQGLYSTAPGHTFTHIYYDVTPIVRLFETDIIGAELLSHIL